MTTPRTGAPGTTDQLPTWEGPPENTPAGYLPAEDNPSVDRDAAGENLRDPDRSDLSDAFVTRDVQTSREDRIRIRAHELWERDGKQKGTKDQHWYAAEAEIDAELDKDSDTQATAGAGPALAERSKDAATSAPGRQPGAYNKDDKAH